MPRDYQYPEYMEHPRPDAPYTEVEPSEREETGCILGPRGEVLRRFMDRPAPGYRSHRDEWRR